MGTCRTAIIATVFFAASAQTCRVGAQEALFAWQGPTFLNVGDTLTPQWTYSYIGNLPAAQGNTYECCNPNYAPACTVQIRLPDGTIDYGPPESWTYGTVTGDGLPLQQVGQYNVSLQYFCFWVAHYPPSVLYPNGKTVPTLDGPGKTTIPEQ
jgi:hypothetical protein